MSPIWAFDRIENKHTLYHRKNCMRTFCESLREHAKNIIDFEKNKMLLLAKEELKPYQDTRVFYVCGKKIFEKLPKSLHYQKVRDHCPYLGKYKGATHSICNFKSNVLNETPVFFHNRSN